VNVSGVPAPALSESGALPAGVTFNSSTGVLSGKPAAGTGGRYPISFTATNAAGTANQTFTLIVNQPPAITTAGSTTFTVGSAGSLTVTASGFPASTLSVSGPVPAGVTFNASTGVLSGTPAVGAGGTYNLTFTATNGVSPDANLPVTITVNEAPMFTSGSVATFTHGVAGSFRVTATGYPAPTFSIGKHDNLPTGVTLDSTGVLSGTPTQTGTFTVTITAHNATNQDATQSFTLTVS
jgi:hypothetical protein